VEVINRCLHNLTPAYLSDKLRRVADIRVHWDDWDRHLRRH